MEYLAGKIARARKPELYTPGVATIRRNFTLLAEFNLIPQYADRVANEVAAKLTELDESFNGAEFAAGVEKRQKAAKRDAARVERAAVARDEKGLADWRLGVPGVHYFAPASKQYAGLSFLRVAGEYIATSQNLRFPREVARVL